MHDSAPGPVFSASPAARHLALSLRRRAFAVSVVVLALAAVAATTSWYARMAGPFLSGVSGVGPAPGQPAGPAGWAAREPALGWALALLGITAIRAVAGLASAVALTRLRLGIGSDFRDLLLGHALRLDGGERDARGGSAVAETVLSEARRVEAFVQVGMLGTLRNLLVATALATTAWQLDSRLATFGAILVPLGGLAAVSLGRRARKSLDRAQGAELALASRVHEAVRMADVLAVFGATARSESRLAPWARAAEAHAQRAALLSQLLPLAIQVLGVVAALGVVASGAVSEAAREAGSEAIVSLVVALLLLYRPLEELLATGHALVVGAGVFRRLDGFLSLPVVPDASGLATGAELERSSSLRVADLSFAYGSREVLRGVQLEVPSATIVAIVGPSGSGKSTLLSCLVGARRPSAGRVRLGDRDLGSTSPAERASIVGWVPQEPVLVEGTVADNVALFEDEADPGRCESALRRAGVWDVVQAKEGGLHAPLGPEGGGYSVGEQQRICLARALYRDPALLVLDEPTASLDAESERRILETLRALADEGRHVVVATHRLATLYFADRVFELREGRLAEDGAVSRERT
ncbi:MAG: ABC transporter ATP-binding protein [Polyangiales bacterium]